MIAYLKKALWVAVAVWVVVPTRLPAQDLEAFYQRQMAGLQQALGDPSVNSRVRNIWFQLARQSGRMLPVLPAQNFTLGQALPNGVVLLDLSIAGDAHVEVTAFTMAHEYGHQVLGHPQMSLTRFGQWLAGRGGTAQEDAADRYAGRFLMREKYRLQPVTEFLCELPGGGAGDAHSTGPARARIVAAAYGQSQDDPCASREADVETYDISIRMWSKYDGNPTTMEVAVDSENVGSLSNLRQTGELDLGSLTAGRHTFTMTDVTVYGPYGVMAADLECSASFTVSRSRTVRLTARLLPSGEVTCRID